MHDVPMREVPSIHHSALTVSDVDVSADFYVQHLGFALIVRRTLDGYFGRAMGVPNLRAEAAILRLGGTTLELITYIDPPTVLMRSADGGPGAAHLTIVVDDVRAMFTRLCIAGVRFCAEPQAIDHGPNSGGWIAMLLDPDGIMIELLEMTDQRRAERGFAPRTSA